MSQSRDVKLKKFRAIKRGWATHLKAGAKLDVDILVHYGRNGKPTGFTITEHLTDATMLRHPLMRKV